VPFATTPAKPEYLFPLLLRKCEKFKKVKFLQLALSKNEKSSFESTVWRD
jgi:hypothetical protein